MSETRASILLADDERDLRLRVASELRSRQISCRAVDDASAAKSLLEEAPFDLMIADEQLAGAHGLDLVRWVGSYVEGLPIILVSANPDLQTARKAIQLPVVAYLEKPLGMEELVKEIERELDRQAIFRRLLEIREAVVESLSRIKDDGEELKRLPSEHQAKVSSLLASVEALTEQMNEIESLGNADLRVLALAKRRELEKALLAAVEALNATRRQFRSKELARLRRYLESVLEDAKRVQTP
ncbi:response regulator [Pelagicoccus sp. SDUM812003]|uniref:response regulator n=1 Tax=Pelagicoccus sp. SDUM812003 TaxID=3041267 RepID=UPI00280CFF4B|nr:response regulator [Pelagicoccus sp. SDUM812003]MDQ8203869.1 response regulator [Pelagicoccus sp. SDUM812003]